MPIGIFLERIQLKAMSKYHCAALSAQRWGIYYDDRLLATIGDHREALDMLSILNSRQKDSDSTRLNAATDLFSSRVNVQMQRLVNY
jgi:hypothetical protein